MGPNEVPDEVPNEVPDEITEAFRALQAAMDNAAMDAAQPALDTLQARVNARIHDLEQRQHIAEQAAVLQERNRLARDLHDSVSQSLYSLTVLAEAGRRLAHSGDMEQVAQVITRLGEIGQQALKEMRLMVYELRPLALNRVGIVGALQQRLDTVERRAGVEAQLRVEMPLALPTTLEQELYHIAQEALNNVLKHASATAVTVHIKTTNDEVILDVSDNGKGFDPKHVTNTGGIGMVSMEERAEKLSGTLTIHSTPAQQTIIHVTIPLSHHN